MIVVGMDFVDIGLPSAEYPIPVCGDMVEVSLDQIDRVVRLADGVALPAR
jgi:hypothetical protein